MEFYLIGYSGHAYVVLDSAIGNQFFPKGYYETVEKKLNPYKLDYLGSENLILDKIEQTKKSIVIGIGDNKTRELIARKLEGHTFLNIIDRTANLSSSVELHSGIYIGKGVNINALSTIGNGVIVNTSSIIEHECRIGDYVHLAPGSVLCGNVTVGANTFIGANSVIRQGVKIGKDVVIGAGSVVLKDVPDAMIYAGNPAIKIK